MRVLTYSVGGSVRRMRAGLRQVAARPSPSLHGLHSRHWRIDQGSLKGRYLFEDQSSLDAFARQPELDPAFHQIEDLTGNLPVHTKTNESIVSLEVLERPIFIIPDCVSERDVIHSRKASTFLRASEVAF